MVCVDSVEAVERDEDAEAVELLLLWESPTSYASSAIEVEAMDWLGSNLDKVQPPGLLVEADAEAMPASGLHDVCDIRNSGKC